MDKIVVCLLSSLLIGFTVGWFISTREIRDTIVDKRIYLYNRIGVNERAVITVASGSSYQVSDPKIWWYLEKDHIYLLRVRGWVVGEILPEVIEAEEIFLSPEAVPTEEF